MQTSFFDQENRLAQLEKLGDPLLRLKSIVDWDDFKPLLKKVYQKKRKSNAGSINRTGVRRFEVSPRILTQQSVETG